MPRHRFLSSSRYLLIISISTMALLGACSSGDSTDTPKDAYSSEQEKNEMLMADNYKKAGNLDSAAQLYSQLYTKYKSVGAGIEFAAIARKLGHADEAVAIMKELREKHPENPVVLSQLGYALVDAKKTQEAVTVFDTLIAMNPDYALAYSGKGVAFDKAGNHLAAQELYTQALALAPDTLSIQNNMAMSLILNKQIDSAIALLEKLQSKHSDNKTIRQNLALAYGLKGDAQKATALNLKDLPPEQAEENKRFYEQYAKKQQTVKPADVPATAQIGFAETPPEQKLEAAPAAGKVTKAPTEKVVATEPKPSETPKEKPVLKIKKADIPAEEVKAAETKPKPKNLKRAKPAPELDAAAKDAEPVKASESTGTEANAPGRTELPTTPETTSEYPSSRRR